MQIGPDTPAIITGGASGLGAATARRLAAQGAPVALLDLNAAEGEALARDLGGRFIRTDVTDPASVAAALGALSAPPRLCICCAGIASAGRTVDRHGAPHDPEGFARTIAINLTGSFNTATQAAAAMAKTDPLGPDGERGNIVLTASIAAFEGQVGQIAYAASKGGVAAMALPMARDLTALGIRGQRHCPGPFPHADGRGPARGCAKRARRRYPLPVPSGRPGRIRRPGGDADHQPDAQRQHHPP